jgi:hypothetical protein
MANISWLALFESIIGKAIGVSKKAGNTIDVNPDPTPPAPTNPGEVTMVISDMVGDNWNGLGNGTHGLDGKEVRFGAGTHQIAAPTAVFHSWAFQLGLPDSGSWFSGSNLLKLRNFLGAIGSDTASFSQWLLRYNGSYTSIYSNQIPRLKTIADIGETAKCWSTAVIGGVTFTWSEGVDWSRGNM